MRSSQTPKTSKRTKPARRTPVSAISPDEQIVGAPLVGKVRAYDARRREMTLPLEEPLSAGDAVRVKGRNTDLSQRIERLSIGKLCVHSAMPGEIVRVAVADRVRAGDAVYKVRGYAAL